MAIEIVNRCQGCLDAHDGVQPPERVCLGCWDNSFPAQNIKANLDRLDHADGQVLEWLSEAARRAALDPAKLINR